MTNNFKNWLVSGSPWVWLTAGAVSLSLVMVIGLVGMIAGNGLHHFWPARIVQLDLGGPSPSLVLGEIADTETVAAARVKDSGGTVPEGATVVDRVLIKRGNRDIEGQDFTWVNVPDIKTREYPQDAVVVERRE